jgi:hypothetical protein
MRRILLAAVLVPLCVWLALWAVGKSMRRRSESAPWPERLGTVNDVPSHYPDAETSAAAAELMKLAEPLGVGKAKHPLPDEHDPRLGQIRDHILTAGPIAWRVRFRLDAGAPVPNLLVHLNLTKLFARRAESAQSWDELHAAWMLDRQLWDRPELISLLIALAGTRMINATTSCDLANDPVRRTLAVGSRWNWFASALPSIFGDWRKLARFRAELEATSKIIALRGGSMPSSASICSDGTWIIRPDSIAFSRDIAVERGPAYPLTYKR